MSVNLKLLGLWDQLAEFSAEETEAAVNFLLTQMCEILDADNASWSPMVRLSAPEEMATLNGWRPSRMYFLRPMETLGMIGQDIRKRIKKGEMDPTFSAFQKEAGTFRSLHWREMAPPDWFESDFYKARYGNAGISDILFIMIPINRDTESTFAFHRIRRDDHFTDKDAKLLEMINAPLKWFHQRILLSYGLIIADKPLSPTERRIQKLLLTELSEKQIADRLSQNITTTHKHITAIFRKMGVSGRAGLTALWLGKDSRNS